MVALNLRAGVLDAFVRRVCQKLVDIDLELNGSEVCPLIFGASPLVATGRNARVIELIDLGRAPRVFDIMDIMSVLPAYSLYQSRIDLDFSQLVSI